MADSAAKILIIDDNKDLLELHKTVLEGEGFEVHTALGGTLGLQAISEIEQLDLILLDLKMDDIDGLEVLRIVEVDHPHVFARTPIVLLSAMDPPDEPHRAAGYLKKTSGISRFIAAIKGYLDKDKT